MNSEHQKQMLYNVKKINEGTPSNWQELTKISVGGLIGIGFSKKREFFTYCFSSGTWSN